MIAEFANESFSIEAFIFVIILLIYLLTSQIIETRKVPYLHESTIAIFMGAMTAIFAKYGLGKQITFSNQIFFAIILPPIIFSAGYTTRNSCFFENFRLIGFLGVAGTIVGFLCLAAFINLINRYIFNALTLKEVLLLSSALCATDTVAAMALIKKTKFPVLSSIVFGQGILNDAIGIILFRTISEIEIDESNEFTFFTVLKIVFNFTYLFALSVAFGTLAGFGISYLFKKIQSFVKYPIKETALILLNGYFTYLFSELLGLSGIISLFTCAVIMGHYCFLNLSSLSQKGTGLAFETVSYIAEAFVFAYLGASILAVEGKWTALIMAVFILMALPIIRAAMVCILPMWYKITRNKPPLTMKEVKICWFSGMIRGAIAFALCLQIQSKDKKYIITISLSIVMITTILGSTLLKKFKNYIGLIIEDDQIDNQQVLEGQDRQKGKSRQIDLISRQKIMANRQIEQVEQFESGRPLASTLEHFQEKFLKPIFTKNGGKKINYELEEDDEAKGKVDSSQKNKQIILQI